MDAYGSTVILAGIPSDAVVTPLFQVSPIPAYDYLDPYDYSQIPLVAPSPEGQSLQLFLPVVPAGSRTVLGVRLKTSQPNFELRVGIGEAWFDDERPRNCTRRWDRARSTCPRKPSTA